jgi:4-aminobutyrate aminotransferase
MLSDEHLTGQEILHLNDEGLLADVLAYETNEVALCAHGSSLSTYTGKEFIDFTGGIAVHALGHNHPDVVSAIREQAKKIVHTSDITRHAPQLELASWLRELLAAVIPGDPWAFLFMNGGSESMDAAAKLAIKATGRTKFIAFDGAFHGRTLFATALSHSKKLHWEVYEGFLELMRSNVRHAQAPRCSNCTPSEHLSCCDGSCMDELAALLSEIGSEVAAIFFEAEQGEGGYVPMPSPAAARMLELADQHSILIVADEVQCGFGRTGRWFGFEHLGISPDIVVFGKAVGGGLPLAGVAARHELMSLWQPGEHGTTFGGNPIACAAGLAALKAIERDDLVDRADCLGRAIQGRLSALVGHHGVWDVRGWGLMIGIELRDGAGQPDWGRCTAVKNLCCENGLLVMTCGARIGEPYVDNSSLRLIPALNATDDIVERALSILESALESVPVTPGVKAVA